MDGGPRGWISGSPRARGFAHDCKVCVRLPPPSRLTLQSCGTCSSQPTLSSTRTTTRPSRGPCKCRGVHKGEAKAQAEAVDDQLHGNFTSCALTGNGWGYTIACAVAGRSGFRSVRRLPYALSFKRRLIKFQYD